MHKVRAVFLDRDGVIIEDVGHIVDPNDVVLIKGSASAIKMLNEVFKVFIISNQSTVGRGMCTEEQAWIVHDKVLELLAKEGARIDDTYMCFHHPVYGVGKYKVECECRKPKPGMILKAAKEHGIDLEHSYMIGDKTSDILSGKNVGCKTWLVKTGYGGNDGLYDVQPDYVAQDLYSAAKLILDNV